MEDTPLLNDPVIINEGSSENDTPTSVDGDENTSTTSDDQVTVKVEDPWPRTFERSISLRKWIYK